MAKFIDIDNRFSSRRTELVIMYTDGSRNDPLYAESGEMVYKIPIHSKEIRAIKASWPGFLGRTTDLEKKQTGRRFTRDPQTGRYYSETALWTNTGYDSINVVAHEMSEVLLIIDNYETGTPIRLKILFTDETNHITDFIDEHLVIEIVKPIDKLFAVTEGGDEY
ncbi:MAG: hypothetical protein SGI89_13570 [bacterium]|nr:hypothetical protein [bacterium]